MKLGGIREKCQRLPRIPPSFIAYMEVGEECEYDCRDAGGRVTQEQLPRSGSFQATVQI